MKQRSAFRIVTVAILTALVVVTTDTPAPEAGQAPPATGQAAPPAGQAAPPTGQATPPAEAAAPANAKVQFVIGEANIVRVPAEVTTLTATNLAGLEKLTAADLMKQVGSIALIDRGIARGISVRGSFTLGKPEFVGRAGANSLLWRVPVTADVPLSTSHPRVLQIDFGVPPDTQTFSIEYTVSARPVTAAQWTPRGATDVWTVSWSDLPKTRVYGVTIENPDEQLSNLRLAQSTLKDGSGHTIGVDRLRLLPGPGAEPRGGIDVPANSATTVYVRLEAGDSSGPFGTFDGVLRFAADGSPTMKDVSVKVQASSRGQRVIGMALTLAGLLLTIFVSALARPQMARLQARRAAAAVRQGISQFESELALEVPADVQTPTVKAVAARLARSISDEELDRIGLLPSGSGVGPGFEAPADPAAALKTKLDEVSKTLEGLLVLLRSGFPRLLRLLPTADRQAGLDLIKELDEFADRVTSPQDARTKIDDVHRRIPVRRETAALPMVREVSLADLDFHIQTLSSVSWVIWGVIAFVIGAAWIVTDVDYGTPLDLISSFLWGFGMTTFGAGIQNLTPASVATQMNVKLPK